MSLAEPRVSPPGATTRVLALDELGRWSQAWDELVLRSPLPSPFLRSWWLDHVASASLLLLVVSGDRLLGGLALEITARRPLRRLAVAGGGTLAPDHLDLVAEPGCEERVVEALAGWWGRQRRTLVDLRGVREDHRLGAVLGATAVPDDVAPSEPVTSYEGWLATRSGSFRKRLRRLERQAERHGVVFREVADDEVEATLDAFASFHAAREDRADLTREVPRLRRALEAARRSGDLLLVVGEAEGRRGWVGIGFATGDRVSLYQSARSGEPAFDGLGTLLDRALIELGCARGAREIDFLRGAEPYKASFVGGQRTLVRVRAARGPLARGVLALESALRAVRRLVGDA